MPAVSNGTAGAPVTKAHTTRALTANQPTHDTVGAPAPPDNSAALDELDEQIDHLSSREAAVNASLDNLRRQEEAQGLGLRGDVSAAQERVKIQVGKAQQALLAQDITHAKKYANQAETDLEFLEKFLGR